MVLKMMALILTDVLSWLFVLSLSGGFLYVLGDTWSQYHRFAWMGLLAAVATCAISGIISCHYSKPDSHLITTVDFIKILCLMALFSAATIFALTIHARRSVFLFFWSSALITLPIMRLLTHHVLQQYTRLWQKTAIIATTPDRLHNVYEALSKTKEHHLIPEILIVFGENTQTNPKPAIPYITIATKEDIIELLITHPVEKIILVLDAWDKPAITELTQYFSALYPDLIIIPPPQVLPLLGSAYYSILNHKMLMLEFKNHLFRREYLMLKQCIDFILALLALVLLSPFFFVIAISIRLTGPGIFYGHRRIGQQGRYFTCWKFRTMHTNAAQMLPQILDRSASLQEEWARDFKLKNDPRITKIGRFLRTTSLDELPQLMNIVRGEMSLVGPRPIVDEEIQRYGTQILLYFRLKPGMTGLWQISGRNNRSYTERIALDSWYARHWSFLYDFVIILKTTRVILMKKGAY